MTMARPRQAIPLLRQTTYDRKACETGVVHLGYGAFHRAHQAVFIDDYMETTGDLAWGIAAVNLRASETAQFRKSASATDGYLLKTISPAGVEDRRLVRSHTRFEDWASNPQQAVELLCMPSVHAITITVTESGYYLNKDWTLNTADPVIAAELAGNAAQSAYAYLAKAIDARVESNAQGISILCCDNMRANGKILQRSLHKYLTRLGRPDLAEWVNANASFPCSMVDRITPRATPALEQEIAAEFPGLELAPVHAEAFVQWVLEKRFAGPMPDLSSVGVECVEDVDPYEEAKIRILNGGHTGLCYLGVLAGHSTFDQAMANPTLREHFDHWERDEVLPGLDMELPFDRTRYLISIADRFCNVAIADQLERICMDGYSKMPIYIRPTLASCLRQGINPVHGYESVASWFVYARRIANGLLAAIYSEPFWSELQPLLAASREEDFARNTYLWGALPETHPEFVPGILNAIKKVDAQWPV